MNKTGQACTRLASVAIVLVLAGGCTSLNEGQCVAGDWYEIGQRDGASGLKRARLFEHAKACAAYGVGPDGPAYDAGRAAGLKRYCTPWQGFREGNEGHPYRGVCAGAAEAAFLATWRQGHAIHEARTALQDAERTIHTLENKLKDEKTGAKERRLLRHQLREAGHARNLRQARLRRLQSRYRPPIGGYR